MLPTPAPKAPLADALDMAHKIETLSAPEQGERAFLLPQGEVSPRDLQHIQPQIQVISPRETPRGRDMMALSPDAPTPRDGEHPDTQYSQRYAGSAGAGSVGSPLASPMNLNMTQASPSSPTAGKTDGKSASIISGGASSLLSAAPLLPPGWAMCVSCENPVKIEWGSCPKCGTDVGDEFSYSTDTV